MYLPIIPNLVSCFLSHWKKRCPVTKSDDILSSHCMCFNLAGNQPELVFVFIFIYISHKIGGLLRERWSKSKQQQPLIHPDFYSLVWVKLQKTGHCKVTPICWPWRFNLTAFNVLLMNYTHHTGHWDQVKWYCVKCTNTNINWIINYLHL